MIFSQIYGTVSVVSGMAAIWSIMIISMERAWVVYRVSRAQLARLRVSVVRSVVITQWVLAIAVALPPLLGYNRYYQYSLTLDLSCWPRISFQSL